MQQRGLKVNFREIFRVVRFSTFATKSAMSGSRPYSITSSARARSAAAFAINYDGNPGQDGRPAGPALQVLRLQSWYTPRHSKDGICFKDWQSRYRARQLFMHCCLAV